MERPEESDEEYIAEGLTRIQRQVLRCSLSEPILSDEEEDLLSTDDDQKRSDEDDELEDDLAPVALWKKFWHELSKQEKEALMALGYNQDLWEEFRAGSLEEDHCLLFR